MVVEVVCVVGGGDDGVDVIRTRVLLVNVELFLEQATAATVTEEAEEEAETGAAEEETNEWEAERQ